jgi:hypothetical protein
MILFIVIGFTMFVKMINEYRVERALDLINQFEAKTQEM